MCTQRHAALTSANHTDNTSLVLHSRQTAEGSLLTRSPDQLPLEWHFYQVSSTILNSTPGPSNSVFTWKDPAQYRTKALYGILCLPERVRLQMTAEPINDQVLCIYLLCVLVLVLHAASSNKQTISSRRPKGWCSGLISRGSDEPL